MFDLELYKHPDHSERRAPILSLDELCNKRPEERTMPYFSLPVDQLEAHEGYMSLGGPDQGDFLRLLPILWKANGLLHDYSKAIAKELRITEISWNAKRDLFIRKGLLESCPDGIYLLNREFRQQYLNVLKKANSRRH